jgi:hypothetical protein
MLSFHIHEQFGCLQIDLDAEGMGALMGALATLVGERSSHRHLRSPNDLDATTPWGEKAFLEVIINYSEGD